MLRERVPLSAQGAMATEATSKDDHENSILGGVVWLFVYSQYQAGLTVKLFVCLFLRL
jgi:hypothetical protein